MQAIYIIKNIRVLDKWVSSMAISMEYRRVVVTGVFDLLHIGHLRFLAAAKKFGSELVVVVSCDKVAELEKRIPIHCQEDRKELVESLKPVDKAVIGYNEDKYRIFRELNPDVLVLGYDQKYDEGEIEFELRNRGINPKIYRLNMHGDQSSSKIIQKIKERKI